MTCARCCAASSSRRSGPATMPRDACGTRLRSPPSAHRALPRDVRCQKSGELRRRSRLAHRGARRGPQLRGAVRLRWRAGDRRLPDARVESGALLGYLDRESQAFGLATTEGVHGSDCRGSTRTGHDYGRARTVGFGQSAPLGQRDPQWPARAAHGRAIGVRLIELGEQTPASSASTATETKIVAGRTGLGHRPGIDEGVLFQDRSPEIKQPIEGRASAWPVDAGLNGCARRNADSGDAATTLAWRQPGHGVHQRLADREHVGPVEEKLKPSPVLLVGEREAI